MCHWMRGRKALLIKENSKTSRFPIGYCLIHPSQEQPFYTIFFILFFLEIFFTLSLMLYDLSNIADWKPHEF